MMGNDEMNDNESTGSKYRAPALEKGLDVLELLVTEARPLTMSEICARLGRSQGEMFRMVQVLQSRGFLDQDDATDGYYVTDRLFSMAMRQPQTLSLLEIALPRMRRLTVDVGQSCHLAVHARGEIVVIARMESDGVEGFSVRVGRRAPITDATSGILLFAFQPEDVAQQWLKLLPAELEPRKIESFQKKAVKAFNDGFYCTPSGYVNGVTDLSAPVLRGGQAIAALTMPYIKHNYHPLDMEQTIERLVETAGEISNQLYVADNRA